MPDQSTYYLNEDGHCCLRYGVLFVFELCPRCSWWGIWFVARPEAANLNYEPYQLCRCEWEQL